MRIEVRERTIQIDDEDWPRLQAHLNAGHRLLDMNVTRDTDSRPFVYIAIFRGPRYQTLLGRWLLSAPRHLIVDYVNSDTLDLRRANLRLCTRSEDQHNRRPVGDRKFKGIEFNKEYKKWCAKIRLNGKRKRKGWFDTPEEAARCYDELAKRLHGTFARLNFPN